MQERERTLLFLEGKDVDRYPIHPLVMQYACKLSGIPYADYCLDYQKQCQAMLFFAEKYELDSIHAAGFPWCEAMDYGLNVIYDGDLFPHPEEWLIQDVESDIGKIKRLDVTKCPSMMNRVNGIRHYRKLTGNRFFIEGHCEGPFAEYADLRSVEEAMIDLFDYPDEVQTAFRIITENAKDWISLQIEAGADVISIGDAVCSLINADMYREFVLPLHRELVEHIHSQGTLSKIHICGNITQILPDLIEAGVNIIDIDSMVDMTQFLPLLDKNQFFCGNLDPAGLFLNGTPEEMQKAVAKLIETTGRKCIPAGGCEIPKNTPPENYSAFVTAVRMFSD